MNFEPKRGWQYQRKYPLYRHHYHWQCAVDFMICLFMACTVFAVCFVAGCDKEAHADETGIATFYTVKSCQKEGTSGVYTANGERYKEDALTCALRSRDWGGHYKVTNLANGKSVVVRHNDYGPGKKATKRGVIIDLSPKAFDELGGKRGETWGEIKVKVERI